MKAIVYTQYGPPEVLQLKEVAKPVPRDDQVLVKVHAASINALDSRRFTFQSAFGRFMDGVVLKAVNTVLGADMAGRVEAVGAAVKQFQPGDEVYGVAAGSKGAFAEYACPSAEGGLSDLRTSELGILKPILRMRRRWLVFRNFDVSNYRSFAAILLPNLDVSMVLITALEELFLALWLLIRGETSNSGKNVFVNLSFQHIGQVNRQNL